MQCRTPRSLGEREHPGTWKVAAPTPTSVVHKVWSGKQTEIHRNVSGSRFRQQEGRVQQHTEVWLKYHRFGNNLQPNRWGKGRQNSDRRASMDAPPKEMQTQRKACKSHCKFLRDHPWPLWEGYLKMELSFFLPNWARSTASDCNNAHQRRRGSNSGTTISAVKILFQDAL